MTRHPFPTSGLHLASPEEISDALKLWRKAFEQTGTAIGRFLWVEQAGIWLRMEGQQVSNATKYWNGLGNRQPKRRKDNLIVEVNPPKDGPQGGWQGVVALDEDNVVWLLHRGQLRLGPDRITVNISSYRSLHSLDMVTVPVASGSPLECYVVADLSRSSKDVVEQSRRFMDACHQVRAFVLEGSESGESLKKAHLLEEAAGQYWVGAQSGRMVARKHAEVWSALRLLLESEGHKVSNERLGSLGPDLYTLGKKRSLYEIKTGRTSSDYLKAVGQLLVYEKQLGDKFEKFVVLPDGIPDPIAAILKDLSIRVIIYQKIDSNFIFEYIR